MTDQNKKEDPRALAAFYELVQMLRITAMARYEMEVAKETPSEEIAAKLKPTIDSLDKAQHEAVATNFDGVCHAVVQFELDAEAYEDHAKYLKTKADDCRAHAEKLRMLLLDRMVSRKENTHRGLFHSAVVLAGKSKGKDSINLIIR